MKRLLALGFLMAATQALIAQPPKPSDPYQPKPYVELQHPAWSRSAVLYQVNIRQYTPEGSFRAFEAHLPRLKELGVDILWLMPIQPIGQEKRKGKLGSEYSVRDYYGVNPEFGTMADFRHLVQTIHDLGMHVILDWVANHSAWDNALAKQHPEWYTHTSEGSFQPTPWYDWDDVIDFDYEKPGLRKYMTEAMSWWVKNTDIDGYRCDVAGFIPVDFWDHVRKELDKTKPVFLLAEWEARDMHKRAFDATYSWSLYETLHQVTTQNRGFGDLVEWMAHDVNTWPENAYRMTFTDNHDKNSWAGTPSSQFGAGLESAIVFSYVVKGIPLIYNGQEAGSEKMLRFFDKDTIQWREHPFDTLYRRLNRLKHNGAAGGTMVRIGNTTPDQVISFARSRGYETIVAVFNFTAKDVTTTLDMKSYAGSYYDPLAIGTAARLEANQIISLPPWSYQLLVRKNATR
jgi:cyclomaltodextrinase